MEHQQYTQIIYYTYSTCLPLTTDRDLIGGEASVLCLCAPCSPKLVCMDGEHLSILSIWNLFCIKMDADISGELPDHCLNFSPQEALPTPRQDKSNLADIATVNQEKRLGI